MTPASKLRAGLARSLFSAEADKPDQLMRLDRAALLIAAEDEAHARVEVEKYLRRLDELAAEARVALDDANDASQTEAFNRFLFEEQGFAGNQLDYYDPRNSFLNHVLDRRVGIPITLSVVYMEVGRRAGLDVEGVGLPGHFLVRVHEWNDTGDHIVDPFHGAVLSREECQDRLDTVYNGLVALSDEHLTAATTREILVRMLRNLKAIYARSNLHRQALSVVDRILLLAPEDAAEHRDRGALLAQLERFPEAIEATEFYLRTAGDQPDATEVREQLNRIRRQQAMRN